MRKILALILALVTLLSVFSSCSSEKESTTTKEDSSLPASPDLPSSDPSKKDPSEVPSNPPTPTIDEEEERLKKKRYNKAFSTEEDLNVIPVGLYEFTIPQVGKLGYTDDFKLTMLPPDATKNCQFLVSFHTSGREYDGGRENVEYMIYAGDSIKYSLQCPFTPEIVKTPEFELRIRWNIVEKENGKVNLIFENTREMLGYVDKKFVADFDGKLSEQQADFEMKQVQKGTSLFKQFISEKGNIILRPSDKIITRGKVSEERLIKLANDVQLAYETYTELTGAAPFQTIVARMYQPSMYFGYIIGGWNVITFNLSDAIEDLKKAQTREKNGINDWNFCLMHELGHMFDTNKGWNFESETATDIKVAYVLYKHQDVKATATISQYRADTYYDGTNLKEMYMRSYGTPDKLMTTYSIDKVAYMFIKYAEDIGWDNFKKAYHEIQTMPYIHSKKERAELFNRVLAKYAPDHREVKSYFKESEWNVILEFKK